jgi:hypothetical protein
MKLVTFLFSLFLLACHSETRREAENNTVFSVALEDGEYLEKIKNLEIGMPTTKAISIVGYPLWIKDLSDGTITENKQTIKGYKLHEGKIRLSYTYQKNPALDFIRISILSEAGQVVEIENEWYRE